MNEGHRLHEAQIKRAGIEPAGAYVVEAREAPDGVVLGRR